MASPNIDRILVDVSTFMKSIADGCHANRSESLQDHAKSIAHRIEGLDMSLFEPVLTLSTAHITEADDVALRSGFCPPTSFISQSGDCGYTLVVIDADTQPADPDPAPGLESVIEKARALGCSRIRFDSCASTMSDLPVYEW